MDLLDLFVKIGVKDEVSDKVAAIGGKLKGGLAAAAKAGIAAIGSAVAAVASAAGAVSKQSLEAYGAYEQNIGGVQKLFGNMGKSLEEYAQLTGQTVDECADEWQRLEDAQTTVAQNAANAYETAGMSANQYMEQVTSFSAALITSMDNDTQAAAERADMAMVDMSDNVNTFGSNMEDVQNAYQGFAKQNYTMLDNLKLGYGGTQAEMKRLVKDAHAVNDAVDASSLSFDNIVLAIHTMQEQMNIAGTTSREAATTIEGSVNMAKAAWTNWLTEMGKDDADMGKLTTQLVDSATTAAKNIIPRFTQIFGAAIGQLPNVVTRLAPTVVEAFVDLFREAGDQAYVTLSEIFGDSFTDKVADVQNFFDTLGYAVENSGIVGALQGLGGSVLGVFDAIYDSLGYIYENTDLTQVFEIMGAGLDNLSSLLDGFASTWDEAVGPAFAELADAFSDLCDKAQPFVEGMQPVAEFFGSVLATACALAVYVLAGIVSAFSAVYDALSAFVAFITQDVPAGIEQFASDASSVIDSVLGFFTGAANAISGAWNDVLEFFGGIPGKIQGFFSGAGDWLVNAGKSILDGLLGGLKSAWNGVTEFVGGIGSWIVEHKGPLDYDRRMLVPAGKAIMGGLGKGLEDAWGKVQDQVGGYNVALASSLSPSMSAPGAYSARAASTVIHVHGDVRVEADDADEFMVSFLSSIGDMVRLGAA